MEEAMLLLVVLLFPDVTVDPAIAVAAGDVGDLPTAAALVDADAAGKDPISFNKRQVLQQ